MTIAKAIGGHEIVWLCVFGVLGLIPFATVRACTNPPVAMPNGEGLLTNTLCLLRRPATMRVSNKMSPAPALSHFKLLEVIRTQPGPAGIACTLVYGVVVINSQFVPEITLVWRNVRTHKIQPLFCTTACCAHCRHADTSHKILAHTRLPCKLHCRHSCAYTIKGDGRLCRCA